MTEAGYERLLQAMKRGDVAQACKILSGGRSRGLTRKIRAELAPWLDEAAFRGWTELCEIMLERGVSPGVHALSALGRTTEARKMLRVEPELSVVKDQARGYTPMYFAAAQDQPEAVRLLVEFEARVDAEDSSGNTPLHIAAAAGARRSALALIEAGAAVNARNFSRQTPLHWAIEEWWQESSELVKLLLEHGADVNASDENKVTPLAKALASNKTHLVDVLRGRRGREL